MGQAKQIIVKPIIATAARDFVKKNHYSGKVVQNSVLHFGCFLNGVLGGVMQFGNPIDKRNVINIVASSNKIVNEKWNEFLELNRMAFSDLLPKNSESRCIAIAIRLIKKHYPHIKWIISFADGCQCGDGTIYRASGFKLTAVNKNSTIYKLISGEIKAKHGTSKTDFTGSQRLIGYQFRYIFLIDKSCKITVPILPFSKIDEMGAGMYKGEKISLADRRV